MDGDEGVGIKGRRRKGRRTAHGEDVRDQLRVPLCGAPDYETSPVERWVLACRHVNTHTQTLSLSLFLCVRRSVFAFVEVRSGVGRGGETNQSCPPRMIRGAPTSFASAAMSSDARLRPYMLMGFGGTLGAAWPDSWLVSQV